MSVADNLRRVQERITAASERSGRGCDSVQLIAVSKTWPAEHAQKVIDAGHLILGENKWQEGQEKIPAMSPEIEWHFIGGLQRNKVRKVLSLFDVIHSVDSLRLATYINQVAGDMAVRAEVLLQLNLGAEESKGGFEREDLMACFGSLLECQNLDIRGLMCIPPVSSSAEEVRPWFVKLRELKQQIEQDFNVELPYLSMGMSGDFEIAIEEGATHVRVGTSIFGTR